MLKNVIDFVSSRTGITDRARLLREINIAWSEFWNSDDLPNSLQEITVEPPSDNYIISLPWYVGTLRGVKQNQGRIRINLFTPRPYYQDDTYFQSPWTWRILGTSPLAESVTNATTINISIAAAETERFVVTLLGPTDNSQQEREQIVFEIGDTSHESTKRFTDLKGIAKDIITVNNVIIKDSNNAEIGLIPNSMFESSNTLVQITDKCYKICNSCRCFDILYKLPAPYLYYDETPIPYEQVLMTKTLEWISLDKDGQEAKTALFAGKSTLLLDQFNSNQVSVDKKLDLARNEFTTRYQGFL